MLDKTGNNKFRTVSITLPQEIILNIYSQGIEDGGDCSVEDTYIKINDTKLDLKCSRGLNIAIISSVNGALKIFKSLGLRTYKENCFIHYYNSLIINIIYKSDFNNINN